METWEKEHIELNGPKLLETIDAQETLLTHLTANRVITESEKDEILSQNTQCKRAAVLMKIAKTRDCYNILIKSLEMERQDGAVKILRAHSNYRPMLPAPSSEPLPVRVLVVGDDDCKVNRILRKIRKEESSSKLSRNWKGLANDLGLNKTFVNKMETKINLNDWDNMAVLHEILIDWRSQASRQATLEKLLEAFEDNEMLDLANKLREEFVA